MEIKVPDSVPEELLQTLEHDVFNYKRNLIGVSRFLTEDEKKSIGNIENEIYRIQAELQSVSHERVVIDVLSRPVLTEIEHNRGVRIQASKEAYLQRRSGVEQPSSSSTRPTNGKGTGSSPEDPIYIPPYVSSYMRVMKTQQPVPYAGPHQGGFNTSVHNVAVRTTASTTMVPSMRSGYFPPEYKNLRMTPVDYTNYQQSKENNNSNKTKKKKKKAVSFEPLARSLQSKLLTTSQEMKRLKERLTKTDNKFNKERSKSTRKLKLILDALEEKQVWKDHALMSAVEQLIQETLESFQDVVDEVDLLQILEEIVAQIPQPFVYEVRLPPPEPKIERPWMESQEEFPPSSTCVEQPKEENYTLINVQKRPTTIIRLPEPAQTAEIEVQTDKQEEEEDDDDAPPPPPPPLPVVNMTPTVIEVTKPSVEKDLIAILNTVVDSNKAAMQGQQAIILSLVQELAERSEVPEPQVIMMPAPPPVIVKEDKVVDTADLPVDVPSPAIMPVPEHVPSPPAEEPKLLPYRTAFGEVVLGGKTLTGPYAAPPKLTLPQALAQAGLNEFGEVPNPDPTSSTRYDAPVQRRAMPLTMMLLNRPDNKPPLTPAPATTTVVGPKEYIDFTHKLLEVVQQKNQGDGGLSKEEVMKAVQDGVKVGVRTALGYWEDDVEDDYHRGYRPGGVVRPGVGSQQRKGFPIHRMVAQEEQEDKTSARRRVLLDAEDDPLDMRNVRRARDESRQRTKEIVQRDREDVGDSRSWQGNPAFDDLVSLAEEDEEFHALYGDRDDSERHNQTGISSSVSSSLMSGRSEVYSSDAAGSGEEDEEDRDRKFLRQTADYRRNPLHQRPTHQDRTSTNSGSRVPVLRSEKVLRQPLSPSSLSLSQRPAHSRKPETEDYGYDDHAEDAFPVAMKGGLPPLVSSVLPHHATRRVREQGLYETHHALGVKPSLRHHLDSADFSDSVQSSWQSMDSTPAAAHAPSLRRGSGGHSHRRDNNGDIGRRVQARTRHRDMDRSSIEEDPAISTSSLRSSSADQAPGHTSDLAASSTFSASVEEVAAHIRAHKPVGRPASSYSNSKEEEEDSSDHPHWSDDSSQPSEASYSPYAHLPHQKKAGDKKHTRSSSNHRKDAKEEYSAEEQEEKEDVRDDLDHSIASPAVSVTSSTSSIYSFNTSHSSVSLAGDKNRRGYIGRHVSIPLLSVGSAAATQGKARWKM